MTASDVEQEKLSCEQAREIAEALRKSGGKDPLPSIPPALLSDRHIEQYIQGTGAISPFKVGGERNRLKRASYEARIGDKAYKFDENSRLVEVCIDPLVVEANSIVFVECDLQFRLPNYIALRFNLQIRHVHRGLLLGTGPLVDPGFWGKLCIPLHNLTDEDYSIPKSEGLIWIEFTKTSGEGGGGRDALDRDSSNGHWETRKFIAKAASPIDGLGKTVAIRSSIPRIAEKAEKRALDAERSARAAKRWVFGVGLTGILAIVVAVTGLGYAFYSSVQGANRATQSAYSSVIPQVQSLERTISGLQREHETILNKLDKEGRPKTAE